MQKKTLLVIIIIVLLLLALFMWINKRKFALEQRFPRLYQWLQYRRGLREISFEDEELEGEAYAHNYWSHTELPKMTMAQRLKLALQVKSNPEKYSSASSS